MPDRFTLTREEEHKLRLAGAGTVSYSYLRKVHQCCPRACAVIVAICTMIVLSYPLGITVLHRPLAEGPGTHPLTAVLIAALAFVQRQYQPVRSPTRLVKAITWAVLLVALGRLYEIYLGGSEFQLAPMLDRVAAISQSGTPIHTGTGTAFCIAAIAASHLLRRKMPVLAMTVATAAPMVVLVSLVGYSLGLRHFTGEMSLITAILLLPLSLGGLLNFGHHKALRPAFADTGLGRVIRVQLLLATMIPWSSGVVFHWFVPEENVVDLASFIVLMIWFVSLMVILSSRAHENNDKLRRRTERRLVVLSTRDVLTGTANRAGVIAAFQQLPRTPIGVLIVDLDDFKLVNDRYGHLAGDRVLRNVGSILRRHAKAGQVIGRWGGEEFLMLAPGVTAEELALLAEDVRTRIAEYVDEDAGHITASLGATLMGADAGSLDRAVADADRALYKAKALGRNRAIMNIPKELPAQRVAEPEPAEPLRLGALLPQIATR